MKLTSSIASSTRLSAAIRGMIMAALLVPGLMSGCQADQTGETTLAPAPKDVVIMCPTCYAEIVKVRQRYPRMGSVTQTVYQQVCPECNATLTIYRVNDLKLTPAGVLMAKCEHCTNYESVPCYLCVPNPDAK